MAEECKEAVFDIASAAFEQRVEIASTELRTRLLQRAAELRAAYADEATSNPRILEIADDLERLAREDDRG